MIVDKRTLVPRSAEVSPQPTSVRLQSIWKEMAELEKMSAADIVARINLKAAAANFSAFLRSSEADAETNSKVMTNFDILKNFDEARNNGQPIDNIRNHMARYESILDVVESSGPIKWFDPSKGYGFIQSNEGAPDILIHVSSLRTGGFQTALEGARVRFEALKCLRGLRLFRILEIDESYAIHPSEIPRGNGEVIAESDWESAIVKWFNRFRGFGFIKRRGGLPDAFVHVRTLRRFGFAELRRGQNIEIRWGTTAKGPVVSDLRPTARTSVATSS